jgi:hypothetical protein
MRDFQINGECLVRVKFGAQIPGSITNIIPISGANNSGSNLSELGLAEGPVKITFKSSHKDINADDFGPDVPPEVMANLAEASIEMTLVHYDNLILDYCISESMGGTVPGESSGGFLYAGVLPGAGQLMGNGVPLLASGNHYISLNLDSPQLGFPYRFPSAYLENPTTIPLGTEYSETLLNWRAIPYATPILSGGGDNGTQEISSSGSVLWDHNPDK